MKKSLLFTVIIFSLAAAVSCGRKYYTTSAFDQQTAGHRTVAILPAEMIYTGNQPKNLTEEDIARIEEAESKSFQMALYNNILEYANSRKYYTSVNFQDVFSTQKILEENSISTKDSWKKDDKELAQILGVDAVVRMRIQKQRYMSDLASYGIDLGRDILNRIGIGGSVPVPYNASKTNDIYASCNLIAENQTLWNDFYKRASDWNTPANVIIENITENFGRNFPYKKRRKK